MTNPSPTRQPPMKLIFESEMISVLHILKIKREPSMKRQHEHWRQLWRQLYVHYGESISRKYRSL